MTFRLLTSTFRASVRPSFLLTFRAAVGPIVNVPCIHRMFRLLALTFHASANLPSTFCVATGHSLNFHPFFLHLQYFLSGSVYSLLICGTVCAGSIPSRNFPSNVRTTAGPSMNFHQLSVHLRDLLSTSINFSCISGTFNQLSVPPLYLLSTSVNSPCIAGPSVNFCQHFVHLWDLPKSFVQLLVLPSTSVKFPCSFGTICQLSVHPRDLQSTFCAAVGPSFNFSQLFMPPWGLQSTFCVSMGLSVNIHCGRRTICQPFLCSRDSPSTSVNFLYIRGTLRQFYMRPWDCL